MYGDFTRDPLGHAREALYPFAQQGRVHLDSDWNELATGAIDAARWAIDAMLGGSAAMNDSFKPSAAKWDAVTFGAGTYFVDGHRVTARDDSFRIDSQPFLSQHSESWWKDPPMLVYLDVWIRSVSYLVWPDIREIALRGPDTTTRGVLTWQLRGLNLKTLSPITTQEIRDKRWGEVESAIRADTGRRKVWVYADTAPTQEPCIDDGPGGYTGPGNHLYRFEIDGAAEAGPPTMRWSRDNAATEWPVLSLDKSSARIAIRPGARPEPNQWVELVNENSELDQVPNAAVRVRRFDPDSSEIFVDGADWPVSQPEDLAANRTRLRMWDGRFEIPDTNDPVSIERGIRVRFDGEADKDAAYGPGCYWLAPARSTGVLIWPDERRWPWPALVPPKEDYRPPSGPIHHLAPVALVPAGNSVVEDCRWTVELKRKP